MGIVAIPAADLLSDASREFILLAGKDGTGKTNAVLSLAEFVYQLTPETRFFVIDTEHKFRNTLASFGSVPKNLTLYECATMNEATEAARAVLDVYTPGDWLAVESAGRLWERAQDMGYQAIAGTGKAEYMERRREIAAKNTGQKLPPVTPRPDDLWSIIKGAHDTEFLDAITASKLNFILTTGVGRVKEARSNRKENQDRVDFRQETGIDLNLEGAPRLPYYALTGALLERINGAVSCRVWRDNVSTLDEPAVVFDVPTRRDWAMQFWTTTGR